ncbi:MAG: ThuA domain-containing protein [Verrucomicrobiota bacterium]
MNHRFSRGFWLGFLICAALWTSQSSGEARTKHVLFFSKSSGYEHAVIKKTGDEPSHAEKILTQIGDRNDIEFTFTKDGRVFSRETIAKFDAFFFYTTGDLTEQGTDGNPPMSPAGKAAFLEAIRKGKGFIGTHSATDTFHSPGNKEHGEARFQLDGEKADPYVKMIGAEFIKHGSQQSSRMICQDAKFPGMGAVHFDFGPVEEWYSLKDFAPNLHVLLVQDTSGMKGNMYQRAPYPATWARMHGKGRVFYTSMGHREDIWTDPVFQTVLTGGINWAVRNVEADVKPNLNKVTPKANELPPSK